MAKWNAKLELHPEQVRLLVSNDAGDDLLKAQMPPRPNHPRAILTVLEGLALWSGQPIRAAIGVVGPAERSLGEFDALWPAESALVHLDFAVPRRRRRIGGLGDFRQLRLLGDDR